MKKFAPIFVIIAASLWGVDGIVLRPALYSLPVPLVVFVESTIVVLLLSPLLRTHLTSIKKLTRSDLIYFLIVGLFGGAIGTMAITKALFYVNFVHLSVVILLQKLQPVFALILASLILKEKLPREFFIWASFAILGAYLMTFGLHLPNFDTGKNTVVAAILSLIAAASFGSSTVFSKRALKNVSFEIGTYLRFAFSSVIMFFISFFTGDLLHINMITSTQIAVFILIAFTTGGAAIFLYYFGLKNISASVATICELAFPLTAVILDYFVRGTVLSLIQWFGIFILIMSIIKVSGLSFQSKK
ncbi:MAG: DMT family transporter [Melioribacteraceae bacterium]|nr:DMT family transporter [Melioribacteraceae bacterium]